MNKAHRPAPDAFVKRIVFYAAEKKAEEIAVLDLRSHGAPADWFVVCQADNAVHTRAVCDGIVAGMKSEGSAPWIEEGREQGRWILIDYVDVIVHIMLPEAREYYALEDLWSEAEKKRREASDS